MYFSTRTKVLIGTAVVATVAAVVSNVIDQKDLAAAVADTAAETVEDVASTVADEA